MAESTERTIMPESDYDSVEVILRDLFSEFQGYSNCSDGMLATRFV